MTIRIRTASENAELDYSLQKLLDSPSGLERLATETLPPYIRETRDYEAFARKVMFVHFITEADTHPINGEPYIYYPKDLGSHAAIYADDGEVPQYVIEGDGVDVGIFTVASDDTIINLKRLMVQKYNYIERVRELSGQKVGEEEDRKLLDLVEGLLATNPDQVVNSDSTSLTKVDLVELKKKISQHDLPVEAFVMNPLTLDDVLAWDDSELDELTRREILETGVRYQIWGSIKFITSRIIPVKTVYAFSEKEFVGRMPVLKDITTKLTETTNKLEKGLFIFEFIGLYLASHKTIGKLVLS
jgi:hypothetical protein